MMYGHVLNPELPRGWRKHPKQTNHWQYVGCDANGETNTAPDAPVLGGYTYADYIEPPCFAYKGADFGSIVPRPGEAGPNGAHGWNMRWAREWVTARTVGVEP